MRPIIKTVAFISAIAMSISSYSGLINANTVYKISYDYSGASTAKLSYRLQANHDNYRGYEADSVSVAAEQQHYEKIFTAGTTDFNCSLAFNFSGSGEVKIEHLSFVPVEDEYLVGDVNADGTFDIADVVLLQKWLLAVPNTDLKNWKAADLCKDDKLDVFALCLMKRELLKKMELV